MKPFALIRDAVRAKEILGVLISYGFSNLLEQLNLPTGWVRSLLRGKDRHRDPLTTWQRIREACEELGPTFIKIGQILSSRPDLLPQPLVEELKHLRDRVTPEPFSGMVEVLNRELKGTWQDHFRMVEEVPVGSASLAQVHRAELLGSGQTVALKIQRPNIARALQADLEILGWLARELHERVSELRPYHLPDVVAVLRKGIMEELDFALEAHNAQVFNAANPFADKVFAPLVYEEFTSRRLVVMEYINGVSPGKADLSAEERRVLAQQGGESIFHQIILAGFFHADPHPGNILVTEDGRLCLLDWGLAGQLTRRMRWTLADLLKAVVARDAEKVVRLSRELNRGLRPIDEHQLEMDVAAVLNRHGSEFQVSKAGRIMLEIAYALGHNGVALSRDYTLLTKAIVSLEDTGRTLDPEFDIAAIARPFLRKLDVQRYRPETIARDLWIEASDAVHRLGSLPGDVQRVLRRIEREDIGINLRLDRLEHLANPLNQALNRVVLGLIIGSLVIGSSMIMTTGTGPLLWGYPRLGLIGYLISALLGLWVIYDILRHGRHR